MECHLLYFSWSIWRWTTVVSFLHEWQLNKFEIKDLAQSLVDQNVKKISWKMWFWTGIYPINILLTPKRCGITLSVYNEVQNGSFLSSKLKLTVYMPCKLCNAYLATFMSVGCTHCRIILWRYNIPWFFWRLTKKKESNFSLRFVHTT